MSSSSDEILIWLDSDVNQSDTKAQATLKRLRDILQQVHLFTCADECVDFMADIDQQRVLFVISESLALQIITHISSISSLYRIYIITEKSNKNLQEWINTCNKIEGIYSDIQCVYRELFRTGKKCHPNLIPFTIVNWLEDVTNINLDIVEPCFMYIDIFKNIFLTMNFDEQSIKQFASFCRETFPFHPSSQKMIDEFERDYRPDSAVWWYTRPSFIYQILNQALRLLEADIIVTMGFYIADLHKQLAELYESQRGHYWYHPFTVYRGQKLSRADFEKLLKAENGLISFNSFLSMSMCREVSTAFAQAITDSPDSHGILFILTVDPMIDSTVYASIRDHSYFSEEEEMLFSMNTVFRISSVTKSVSCDRVCEVQLTQIKSYDIPTELMIDYIRYRDSDKSCTHQLAELLLDLHQPNIIDKLYPDLSPPQSSENYEMMVESHYYRGRMKLQQGQNTEALSCLTEALLIAENYEIGNDSPSSSICTELGLVYQRTGNYSKAMSLHQQALEICQKTLPSNHLSFATCYDNLGLIFTETKRFHQALAYYNKALEIRMKGVPSDHPDLATSYNNIAFLYSQLGEYSQSLVFHEKALDIRKKSLPSNHPLLATSYDNIACVLLWMNEYFQSLSFCQKALDIREKNLNSNHPDLATSYNNIGLVYYHMREYSQSLSFYKKAFEIWKSCVPPDHLFFFTYYNNIGLAFNELGQYHKALSSFQKALTVGKKNLPLDHYNLVTSCTDMASLHSSVGDYSQSIRFCEKAQDIWSKNLPTTNSNMATSYSNIGSVYIRMGEYSQSLSFYQKALDVREKILPSNHPDIATSCNNMGLVYYCMREYSQSLAFHEKALDIRERSLPATHPDLATSYSNIAFVYSQMGDQSRATFYNEKALDMQGKGVASDQFYPPLR